MLISAVLVSCEKEGQITDSIDDPQTEKPDSINNAGEPTEAGIPMGPAITKNIGTEGGIIETADKTFSITIPAGSF